MITSKELLNRIDTRNYLTEREHKGFLDILETDLETLNKYKNIEKELGIDLVRFLTECVYVLNNATMTTGTMTNGKVVKTDYGYVEDFINGIKEGMDHNEKDSQ